MPAPAIKLCGLTDSVAIDAAITARAEYIGFNFYPPSPRYLSLPQAAELGRQARGKSTIVGVFVDPDMASLTETVAAAGLDAIQLHGSETPELAARLRSQFGLPVWKVLSVAGPVDVAQAERFEGAADRILFDAKTPKGMQPGGMGLAFDWTLLRGYRGAVPWGLAGGLNPQNVADAVRLTGAPLVDAASGIESAPGVKDPRKIAEFCRAARAA